MRKHVNKRRSRQQYNNRAGKTHKRNLKGGTNTRGGGRL